MRKLDKVRQQLELAFAGYVELEDKEKSVAMDLATVMLRQMLREKTGLRQALAELGDVAPKGTPRRTQQSNAKKARSKLVRKSNAGSPKAPIKPVKVTKKNELRRKQ
jgi:hypothetical protein